MKGSLKYFFISLYHTKNYGNNISQYKTGNMWQVQLSRKSSLTLGRDFCGKNIELVFQGLILVSILYVIIIVTVHKGEKNMNEASTVRFARATGGQANPCLLPEETCREKHLRKHLDGIDNKLTWDNRAKHPRYKYEDLIATLHCSEWYILNMTECHSAGQVLDHEDFYCTQKVLRDMTPDPRAYKFLKDHCDKYKFPINRDEDEEEDLNNLSLF